MLSVLYSARTRKIKFFVVLKGIMDPVLLFFIGVAGFVLFRLFSVLGTRTGHEAPREVDSGLNRRGQDETIAEGDFSDADSKEEPVRPVSTNARVLREADPAFDESQYLSGARGAYEMIVEAFAAGDLKSIRAFLGDSVYDAFKQAVVSREGAQHASDVKFVGIEHAAIVDAKVDDDWMTAVTEFTSNQVRVTRDQDGNVVEGDPNRIELVRDRWTFARKKASRDPNWLLVATGGA